MESNWSQKGALPSQNALNYVTIHLKIFLASPKITLLQIQILIICFFQYLLLIRKLQQMVCFIELIISGIQKVLFPLWFAVIAVGHHQIPVYVLFHHVLWADVIFTDVWASMGQEGEAEERKKIFGGKYQVNKEPFSYTHLLPHLSPCLTQ